jgi:hypothetical protein
MYLKGKLIKNHIPMKTFKNIFAMIVFTSFITLKAQHDARPLQNSIIYLYPLFRWISV